MASLGPESASSTASVRAAGPALGEELEERIFASHALSGVREWPRKQFSKFAAAFMRERSTLEEFCRAPLDLGALIGILLDWSLVLILLTQS